MPARTKKVAQQPVVGPDPSSSDSETEGVARDASGSESEGEGQDESGSDHQGGSDSLDSDHPRKRRRISPEPEEEDDDDDDEEDISAAPVSFISAPSRVKRNTLSDQTSRPRKSNKEDAAPPADVFGGATTAPTDPNTTFESLGVHPWLVQSLSNMAIKRPTGIQKGCIPEILKGRDCIGGSRTGSGKTVAFAVPILQKWAEDPSAIFAVVLTPTR